MLITMMLKILMTEQSGEYGNKQWGNFPKMGKRGCDLKYKWSV